MYYYTILILSKVIPFFIPPSKEFSVEQKKWKYIVWFWHLTCKQERSRRENIDILYGQKNMIYLGLKVFYHIHFTGIIIEMMITEVEETVMKGERKSRQGEILRLLHNIILYSKTRTDLFRVSKDG